MNGELEYLRILNKILTSEYAVKKSNRTGIDTISISGEQFQHDMRIGFPLLTTKKMGIKNISAELEFFIKGYSDKKWLQERNCNIWDSWCNPLKVSYANDELTKTKMKNESDLGRIYGVQWRDWKTADNKSFDQLNDVILRAKKDPLDRRLIVTAWRPDEFNQQALPPCHYTWQILSNGIFLDLIWIQRSNDFPVGNPYNIASYALLLMLLSKELNLIPRLLTGQFADVHIYENQIEGVKEQLSRIPYDLPTLKIPNENWNGIFNWKYTDLILENYIHHSKIIFPVAV